jgi:predicted RNA-binding Zn ribbon-like protein
MIKYISERHISLASKEQKSERSSPKFELIAGALCLDFLNTLDDRYSDHPNELLRTYEDLARFAEETGILTTAQVHSLIAKSHQHPEQAKDALAQAIRLREATYAVFWARLKKKPVPQKDLSVLNEYIQTAAQHMILEPRSRGFEWRFDSSSSDFDAVLWPIARSAADLLASDQLEFVRACASKTCEWLFLDESKNHRRRWCDMTKCGNRAKVRSFYKRQKTASP